MSDKVLLIADPNGPRRSSIIQNCARIPGIEVLGATTIGEIYGLVESRLPKRVAIASEMAGLREFAALLDMVSMIGGKVIVFGDPQRARLVHGVIPLNGPADSYKLIDAMVEGLLPPRPWPPRRTTPSQPGTTPRTIPARPVANVANQSRQTRQMILIGASTGGILALEQVLQDFPANCPPTLIVQHIRPGFAQRLISRLDRTLTPRVTAAEDGVIPQPGVIYVATESDRHLGLCFRDNLRIRLLREPAVSGHLPSVDVLFSSGAAIADRFEIRAALLTGMGADGAEGMCALHRAGALTIAQDKETSVVWGMPRVAIEKGGVTEVLPLPRIGRTLLKSQVSQPAAAGKCLP